MRKVKEALKQGKSVLGTMILTFDSPSIARVLAASGFDFFIIDTEHSAYNYTSVANIVAVARGFDISTIVRIPKVDRECIQKYLDMGVDGIMIPQTETVQQIKDAVQYAKYKPMGERGIAFASQVDYRPVDGMKFMEESNKDGIIIVQIETQKAVDNIDELLSVDGVDIVLFGPNDLSQNLGVWGQYNNPIYTDAVEKVVYSAKEHNVFSGNHCGSFEDLEWGMERGMTFIVWNHDAGMMMQSATAGIKRIKSSQNFHL